MNIAPRTALVLSAFFLGGCAHNTTQREAEIVRTFASDLPTALAAVEKSAISAGFVKYSDGEYRFTTSTKKDPILSLVEVSKEMRTGIGMRVEVMASLRPVMISFHPEVMADTLGTFIRTPAVPGSSEHSRVVSVVENARALAERAEAPKS